MTYRGEAPAGLLESLVLNPLFDILVAAGAHVNYFTKSVTAFHSQTRNPSMHSVK